MLGGWQSARTHFPEETEKMIRLWSASWQTSKLLTIAAALAISAPLAVGAFFVGKFIGTTNNNVYPNIYLPSPATNRSSASTSENDELRHRTSDLATRMRVFQEGMSKTFQEFFAKEPPEIRTNPAAYQAWEKSPAGIKYSNDFMELANRYNAAADQQFRSEALALLAIMEKKTGHLEQQRGLRMMWLRDNAIAGPHPLSDAADVLEELARSLPP